MSQKNHYAGAPSSSSERISKGQSSSKHTSEEQEMPSKFNRVRVADLLNADGGSPSRGKSRKKAPSSSDSDSPSREEIVCKMGHCRRKFPSKEALIAHQRRSHQAPTEFVCKHCSSSFSTPPNLNKHIRSVHEKVKPFKCDQCTSTFAFRDGLQRHKRMVHEQVRPFPCDHCTLRFKTKSHLLKHSYSLHPGAHKASLKGSKGAGPSNEH